MSIEDLERWERRHRDASRLTPRASVLRLAPAPFAGALALDVACGQGRHVAELAHRGWNVVAADVSRAALGHARRRCEDEGEAVAFVQADTDAWPFAPGVFDLVVQVDFLDRRLFPLLEASLRPGGLLLVDTFLDQGVANAEGPSSAAFLLAAGELPRAFPGLEVLRYGEVRGDVARATLLARRRSEDGAAGPRIPRTGRAEVR